MSKVIFNKRVSKDMYLLKAGGDFKGDMGQFAMLRAWESYPVLSRPISIHDIDEEGITFLYKVVGQGTKIISELHEGDEIKVEGPHGNGFPNVKGKIALVGGGAGIAPLYLAAKNLKAYDKENKVDVYLGFSDEEILVDEYKKVCDNVTVNVGGFITDDVNPHEYDYIFACGPKIMMETLFKKSIGSKAEVFVSLENRMACGVGACLVCTCKTHSGNKKVCKDGPVFLAEEVFENEQA